MPSSNHATKAVLVATIGTRDLMFQVCSGQWYNIGDDRMQDGDIIGEQAEVICDLNLSSINYRNLTQHLLRQINTYQERIKPVIIGKLQQALKLLERYDYAGVLEILEPYFFSVKSC